VRPVQAFSCLFVKTTRRRITFFIMMMFSVLASCRLVDRCQRFDSDLQIEIICFSETLTSTDESTRRQSPQRPHRRENLKYHNLFYTQRKMMLRTHVISDQTEAPFVQLSPDLLHSFRSWSYQRDSLPRGAPALIQRSLRFRLLFIADLTAFSDSWNIPLFPTKSQHL
jgi:hypothetical protein